MIVPNEQLRGVPFQEATNYAGYNVGVGYESGDKHEPVTGRCVICKAFDRDTPAENAHHEPPKGIGGGRRAFSLRVPEGCLVRDYDGEVMDPLRPTLFAVCGSGTTGCHGKLHSGRYVLEWHWRGERDEKAWWSGDLYRLYGEHNPLMDRHGYWTVTDRQTGQIKELKL